MKRNLSEAIIVFDNKVKGQYTKPDDLSNLPENFNGDVIIHGDLCGEGDINLKGNLWVFGKIEIEGDIEVEFIYARGITCNTLKAINVENFGEDMQCCEIIVAGDLKSISTFDIERFPVGGSIDCEENIAIMGNLLCKNLSGMDVDVKEDLCVYENIVAGDLKVKGNLICRENIMVEDLVVSNNIYCGNNINSEQDIFVKHDVLCKDIVAIDISVDGDLFSEDISARDLKIGGLLQCRKIEVSSINLDLD